MEMTVYKGNFALTPFEFHPLFRTCKGVSLILKHFFFPLGSMACESDVPDAEVSHKLNHTPGGTWVNI